MIQQELNLKFVYDKQKNTIVVSSPQYPFIYWSGDNLEEAAKNMFDFLKVEGFYTPPVKNDFQHEIGDLYSEEEPYDIDEVDRGYDEYDTMIENCVPTHEEIEEEWKRLEELEKNEPFNQPLNKPLEFQ